MDPIRSIPAVQVGKDDYGGVRNWGLKGESARSLFEVSLRCGKQGVGGMVWKHEVVMVYSTSAYM